MRPTLNMCRNPLVRLVAVVGVASLFWAPAAGAFTGMGTPGVDAGKGDPAKSESAKGKSAKKSKGLMSPKEASAPKPVAPWKDKDAIISLGKNGTLTYRDMKDLFPGWSRGSKGLDELEVQDQELFFKKYYNESLFAAVARERGYDKSPTFRARTLASRYRTLMPVYKQRTVIDKTKPKDEELMQYIAPAEDEVRVRIIVKESSADADKIYARVKAGEDFEKLARAESEGNLREAGGLTGFLSPHNASKFPPPVVERFIAQPVGAVLPPFFQDIGYLVVKIDAKRTKEELRKQEARAQTQRTPVQSLQVLL